MVCRCQPPWRRVAESLSRVRSPISSRSNSAKLADTPIPSPARVGWRCTARKPQSEPPATGTNWAGCQPPIRARRSRSAQRPLAVCWGGPCRWSRLPAWQQPPSHPRTRHPAPLRPSSMRCMANKMRCCTGFCPSHISGSARTLTTLCAYSR